MMYSVVLLVFAVGSVVAAQSHEGHPDHGDYGHYTTWRKAVCEKGDQDMYKEMDECFKLEKKVVVDATTDCTKEAHPETEGQLIPFMNAACKDVTLFHKFDDCFDEYEANAAFKSQMEITPEIEACYEKIIEKYSLESLKDYLKKIFNN